MKMGHAGQEAQLYVPRLLSVIGSSEAAGRCFREAWHKVPLPLLLPWVAQMLSLLDAPQGEAMLPLLKVSLHAAKCNKGQTFIAAKCNKGQTLIPRQTQHNASDLTVVLDETVRLVSQICCYAARVQGV